MDLLAASLFISGKYANFEQLIAYVLPLYIFYLNLSKFQHIISIYNRLKRMYNCTNIRVFEVNNTD